MPTDLVTWRASAAYAVGTQTALGVLDALNTALAAHAAANPSTYLWSVAQYNTSGVGVLLLKPSVNNTGRATRRIMLFGSAAGSVPNSAAISPPALSAQAAAAANLYIGCAPTAGLDAPQQSYGSGAPFTSTPWIPGGLVTTVFTSLTLVRWFETIDGIVFVLSKNPTSSSQDGSVFGAGGLMVDPTDTTAIDCAFATCGLLSTNMLASAAVGTVSLLANDATAATTAGRCVYLDEDATIGGCYRLFCHSAGAATGLFSTRMVRGSGAFFVPILMGGTGSPRLAGKMRQMAFGPGDLVGSTRTTSAVVVARCLTVKNHAVDDALWMTDFRV